MSQNSDTGEDIPESQLRSNLGDFERFVKTLWAHKLLISVISSSFLAVGIASIFLVTPIYEGTATFFLKSNSSNTNLISNDVRAAASLAGIDLGGPETDEVEKAMATFRSNNIAVRFVKDQELVPKLFSERWSNYENTWASGATPPTDWEIAERWFDDVAYLSRDDQTGLVTLRIRWPVPAQITTIAMSYIIYVDASLRTSELSFVSENLVYLEAQYAKYSSAEIRETISRMLEAQLRRQMLARSSGNYITDIIDKPLVPTEPVFPKPALFILASITLGLVLSINIVLIEAYRRNRRSH